MKVSVIIPVYNARQFIKQCIDSVARQTLKDLEVLCVDDGSTDSSPTILRMIQEKDNRIKIITQANQGAGIARNNGLMQAEGEFILFLDSDDYLLDASALDKMYVACKKHKVSICGAYKSCDRQGTIVPMGLHRNDCLNYPEGRKMLYKEYQNDFHYTAYLYERNTLIENHILFPPYRRFQDPPFFVNAMIASKEFYIIPVELYCVRVGHQNYTFSHQKVNDIVRGITDVLTVSANNDLRKLHLLEVSRLNEGYFWNIIQHLTIDNSELLQLLVKANKVINWNWVEEKGTDTFRLLKALQYCLCAAEEKCNTYKDGLKQKGYGDIPLGFVFPFHKVPIHSRIVLYAAGNMGWNYYRQIINLEDYELVGWVDRQYKRYEGKQPVISPVESVHQMIFDYIVIAIEDENTAIDIMESLKSMGISPNKIIWSLSL